MKKEFVLILVVCIPLLSLGQNKDSLKAIRKSRPTYVKVGTGLDFGAFKDAATSPLVYRGLNLDINLGKIKMDTSFESEMDYKYLLGAYIGHGGYQNSASFVNTLFVSYSQLRQVQVPWSNRWNLKVGGAINVTGNIRFNADLGNNNLGYELFGNLLGSAQLKRDLSRKKEKVLHIWFIKYHLKPKSRNLALRLNAGIVNTNLRNGYAYTGQSQVINNFKPFDGYHFNTFTGMRFGSKLIYTKFLKNKNAIRWTYQFDAYSSGGNVNAFGMSHNTLSFALLFNTK